MRRRLTRRALLATGSTLALAVAGVAGCTDRTALSHTTSGTFNDSGPNPGDRTIALYGGDWLPASETDPDAEPSWYALSGFGENASDHVQDLALAIKFRADGATLHRTGERVGVLASRERFEFAFTYPGEPDDVATYVLTWEATRVPEDR